MKHLTLLLFLFCSTLVQAQSETQVDHSGLYIGLNGGIQNLFGGSFVNDIDILAQESRFVSEIPFGYRWQLFNSRFIAGLEVHIGFTDGKLSHQDANEPLEITYKNKFQSGKGITLGVALGRNRDWILFGYAHETKRKFDVDIRQREFRFQQTDKQGMLKYGFGVEKNLFNKFNIRGTFGALNVDFGDLPTNIDVEDKFDFTLGFIYQLRSE